MNKPLECLLPDTSCTLLGDITPSQRKVLDAVIDVLNLAELHQCLPQFQQ
jgi:hypothetical protein